LDTYQIVVYLPLEVKAFEIDIFIIESNQPFETICVAEKIKLTIKENSENSFYLIGLLK
jgi:hypothetical protein